MSIEYLTRAAANEATTAQAEAGTATGVYISPAKLRDGLNASGSAPVYACRAWVNFNGTGTVAIRASGNVSSITDNSTGQYTVNFATAMPDTNYATIGTSNAAANTGKVVMYSAGTAPTTSSVFIVNDIASNITGQDSSIMNVAIFR